MTLNIKDVRAEMPNYDEYKGWEREGEILGIAMHHSATADRATGAPIGDAFTFFNYHVNVRGWSHGGYNYVIPGDAQIQYALDEKISAYHAGFKDPDNSEGLEQGQYWNNHYLAICLSGWFADNRTYQDADGQTQMIPNDYTGPTEAQRESLLGLIQYLRQKYNVPVENVRGHRELAGNSTSCPGLNFDPAEVRAQLRALDEAQPTSPGESEVPTEVHPGEHVLLLPDADKYLEVALAYIWKFHPDVSFSVDDARGRWKYMTVIGDTVTTNQLAQLRSGGAEFVQPIPGDPATVRAVLDKLVEENMRFLVNASEPELPPDEPDPEEPEPDPDETPPEETWRTYTIQPGDTLSLVARQMYGKSHLWQVIYEANRDTLTDPGRVYPGQVLKIPPLST